MHSLLKTIKIILQLILIIYVVTGIFTYFHQGNMDYPCGIIHENNCISHVPPVRPSNSEPKIATIITTLDDRYDGGGCDRNFSSSDTVNIALDYFNFTIVRIDSNHVKVGNQIISRGSSITKTKIFIAQPHLVANVNLTYLGMFKDCTYPLKPSYAVIAGEHRNQISYLKSIIILIFIISGIFVINRKIKRLRMTEAKIAVDISGTNNKPE